MSNRTDPLARTVHGTNPQNLLPLVIRKRIYEFHYWKEHCFGLAADTVIDKAVGLQYIGGTYGGNRKPTPFLCLVLKLLQIGPADEVMEEYLNASDFKYLQALGAFYVRLTAHEQNVYRWLEPLLNDNRKLIVRQHDGGFKMVYMDVFIDDLLHAKTYLDVALPELKPRRELEMATVASLSPRPSLVAEEFADWKRNDRLAELPLPGTYHAEATWDRS
eukprot:Gregarina_sp_Poly_1__5358@NODE_282_length_10089_cov_123_197964_g244_i0_p7_GENE_NODE_282_length_10089_cov_123_197964_g244_i0NODE_282_length_10089_cov_123_197964_g244_i0_p7_ORF_typecomplete_len218_score26_41PRP38/PF03371_15/2e56_NODE_282_length_10089_cov_123_197964_g244_i074688121